MGKKKPVMLSPREYAEKYGYKIKTVHEWCRVGWLHGVEKKKRGNAVGICTYQYLIPQDAQPVKPKRAYVKKKPAKPKLVKRMDPPTPRFVLQTNHEKAEHIKRFCGLHTYKQLSEETGWPIGEVRRVYERLHEAYGV